MPSKHHEAFVADLIHRTWGAQRYKFGRAVAAIAGGEGVLRREEIWPLRVTPDAFLIEGSVVTAFEVEVHCAVSPLKLRRYTDIWVSLGDLGFEFRLVRVDSAGAQMHVDLAAVEEQFRLAHVEWMATVVAPDAYQANP